MGSRTLLAAMAAWRRYKMPDTLILGGIAFDSFSTPDAMGAGGKQHIVVHKLPGGQRVIDTLGPDEDNITWSGKFYGNNAYANALALDGMRAAGQVVPLIFGGQFRSVIIDTFSYHIRRLPEWVEYSISCMVYQNQSLGTLGGSLGSIDTLILGDIALAIGL
jgi:hypothetical protein